MGTEDKTDRGNRKAELTTDRLLGAGEEEGSKESREILHLGGRKHGDAITKNRQHRRWYRAEREDDNFYFAHTEMWRCILFYL